MLRRIIIAACLLGCVGETAHTQESDVRERARDAKTSKTKPNDDPAAASKADAAKTPESKADPIRQMQSNAVREQSASWGHWGNQPDRYSTWTNHSNRLIPVYTFGFTLDSLRDRGSQYSSPKQIKKLYGRVPEGTLNPSAMYYDQTDIYTLQQAAFNAGYSNIILMVFDGMDWQTTRAASIYKRGKVSYDSGRGTGLSFQDFREMPTDFGLVCTSPWSSGAKYDVDSQTVINANHPSTGGYDPSRGGATPWQEQSRRDYLLGLDREMPHSVADSAATATSLSTGIKTFNGSINFAPDGTQVVPIARQLQDEQDFRVGIVTSVPVSHATPAACYANNVTRKDYQDIARDLLGLPSSSHRSDPLPGVDVLIGGGWGESQGEDSLQGRNFAKGNPYLHQDDLKRSDVKHGGRYVVAQRESGKDGAKQLMNAAQLAVENDDRLLGFFGTKGGHLPFQTADGRFNPTFDVKGTEQYSKADLHENPTLAEMTSAALVVLEQAVEGFWLLIEAGDVDWANHANNIDNSIGAVLSGEAAFDVVTDWIERNNAWQFTAVIVTADHGHFLVIDEPQRIAEAGSK
tara:strand:- start:322445 stop:324169 length:1725 start_codon:yes stop_codon:yes gene_type:complete